jgi:hypothetical protein
MFFIVWGFKYRWSVKRDQGGQFFCPKCGGDRAWALAVARRWFTLFWIPLFPTGKPAGEAVQCETCKSRFEPAVLHQPTSTELSTELQGSMRLGVAAVVQASGAAGSPAAVEAVQRTGFADYDHAALEHDLATLDPAELGQHLTYLDGALTLPGKEQFLSSLVRVAETNGGVDAARTTLERIGEGLGLSPAHVTGVLASPAPATAGPADGLVPPVPPAPPLPPADEG